MNERSYQTSRCKYTGPTMLLGKNDQIELREGMEVEAEVNTNIATIVKIYDTDGSTIVLNDAKVEIAAIYLEYVKPRAINFDPMDDYREQAIVSEIKAMFSKDEIYYTPKKAIDFPRKEARKRPGSDNFERVLSEMADTHIAKNHDYSNSFSDLFKEFGMTYAYMHLKEKLNRIHALMKSRQRVKQESMLDSLMDLANYAVMTIAELKKEKADK